jgi:ABC-type transport system involved in cytochrome c biogenesis permease subunit
MEVTLEDLTVVLYFTATLAIAGALALGRGFPRSLLRVVLISAVTLHASAIGWRSVQLGQLAVVTTSDSLSLLALLLVGVYLVLEYRAGLLALGAVVVPLAFGLELWAGTSGGYVHPVPPVLRSVWLPVHVLLAVLGDALFALAFASSLLYLVQERRLKARRGRGTFRSLPSLETLDRVSHRCLVWGLVLLTLGIASGIVWAHVAWSEPWTMDVKLLMTLAIWALYVILLQGRMTAGWRGRWAAQLTIAGFAVVVASLVGLSVLGVGSHGGAY